MTENRNAFFTYVANTRQTSSQVGPFQHSNGDLLQDSPAE
jgi:hypothetical protein